MPKRMPKKREKGTAMRAHKKIRIEDVWLGSQQVQWLLLMTSEVSNVRLYYTYKMSQNKKFAATMEKKGLFRVAEAKTINDSIYELTDKGKRFGDQLRVLRQLMGEKL